MGLVEYSDSDSDGEPPPTTALQGAAVATQPVKKQSFQKLVDKSNPNKILVSLPSVPTKPDETANSEAPAAKRLKTGGSRFSGFSSFLPPPKATSGGPLGGGSGKPAPRVGVNLKTSSEAAFSRDGDDGGGDGPPTTDNQASLSNSPSAAATVPAQPVIPAGQKPEGDVELVGKPLMFKPLSVARKPGKKAGVPKTTSAASTTASTTASHGSTPNPHSAAVNSGTATRGDEPAVAQIKKKKASLFSVVDDTQSRGPLHEDSSTYGAGPPGYDVSPGRNALGDYASQQQYAGAPHPPVQEAGYPEPTSLGSIADDLNLDAAARRELFGRGGAPTRATAKSVINFNLDQEYRHNEELRQSGALDQQQHNPLRAIKPGKHSLQQLVNQVQSQRDALEENFAKNRATQKQSGAKYGF